MSLPVSLLGVVASAASVAAAAADHHHRHHLLRLATCQTMSCAGSRQRYLVSAIGFVSAVLVSQAAALVVVAVVAVAVQGSSATTAAAAAAAALPRAPAANRCGDSGAVGTAAESLTAAVE